MYALRNVPVTRIRTRKRCVHCYTCIALFSPGTPTGSMTCFYVCTVPVHTFPVLNFKGCNTYQSTNDYYICKYIYTYIFPLYTVCYSVTLQRYTFPNNPAGM